MHEDRDPVVGMSPEEYARLFRGPGPAPGRIAGVCGRVVRGRRPEDFERLAFTAGRRLAWVLGPDGLRRLLGRPGAEIVLGIGKTPTWLGEKLTEGMTWKLVVLPQQGCRLADWDGLFAMVEEHYPEVAPRLLRWREQLRDPALARSLHEERTCSAVRDDPSHEWHLTVERYLSAEDTPENARLFLWHSLGVNDQFTGTGWTRPPGGPWRRGVSDAEPAAGGGARGAADRHRGFGGRALTMQTIYSPD